MNTTQLTVNPENLVKNLRFSFTQATTVLGELMQNSRRAGATSVSFDYVEATRLLTVRDNGCGIDSLATLLTVAESGWNADIIEREQPYGIGFLSALFSCEFIRVESKGGCFSAPTEDLLSFKPVTIKPVVDWNGITTITLQGFKPEAQQIENHLQRLAKGFPISVILNSVPLERTRAVDAGLQFVNTGIGQVYLNGLSNEENWLHLCPYFHLYLQGLPVYHSDEERYFGHIVHLDSARFHARLPDRDKLIDEADVVAEVKRVLQREARQKLEQLKQQLQPTAFAEGYETLKAYRCLDLLNDVPVLPKQVLAFVQDFPIMEGCDAFNLGTYEQPVTQEDVLTGKVNIAELDDFDSVGAARWMFAWHRDLLIYRSRLDAGHWLLDHLVDLNAQAVRIEIIGETHRASFQGQWVEAEAVFCEQYRLTIGDECVVIENDALYDEDGCLFIVPKGDASGAVVGQASSYHDEWDSFNESIKEADEWAFQNFVIANTSVDPAQALQRLLPSFNSCPALFGKRFQLELNESGQIAAVVEIR